MDLNSLLLEILTCQVCWEPLIRPIYRCRFEHLLCQRCYPKLSKCPTCQQPIKENLRSLSMEKVADVVRVACKYSSLGCPEQLQLKTSRRHEDSCDFRPEARVAHCPFVYSCSWLGSRADVERHVSQAHEADLVIAKDGVYRVNASGVTVLKFDYVLFVLRAESVVVADFTSHYVHVGHVAQGSRAAEARYSFKAHLEPNGPIYKGCVTDYRQSLEDLVAAGGCLFFVSQAEDEVSCSIAIKKLL